MAVEQVAENHVGSNSEPSDRNGRVGWLICQDEDLEFPVTDGLIVVGRHPNCEISLDSVRVSRVHCCVYVNSGRVFVRDLNSTNGVKINGQRVSVCEILDQDLVLIGQVKFKYINANSKLKYDSERRRVERTMMEEPPSHGRKPKTDVVEAGLEVELQNVIKKRLSEAGDDCRVEVHVHWKKPDSGQIPDQVEL
jgi:pSer/pThr/pTyr-binding forkhead associated (FHA) protein